MRPVKIFHKAVYAAHILKMRHPVAKWYTHRSSVQQD